MNSLSGWLLGGDGSLMTAHAWPYIGRRNPASAALAEDHTQGQADCSICLQRHPLLPPPFPPPHPIPPPRRPAGIRIKEPTADEIRKILTVSELSSKRATLLTHRCLQGALHARPSYKERPCRELACRAIDSCSGDACALRPCCGCCCCWCRTMATRKETP
jgi:hypothetical protein